MRRKKPMKRQNIQFIVKFVTGLLITGTSVVAQSAVNFFTDPVIFNNASVVSMVEDFEAFSPKDVKFPSFTSNGIVYTGFVGSPFPNIVVASPGYTNFGVKPATTSSVLASNGDEDFLITLDVPTTAIGFDTYLNSYGPAIVTVFGKNGMLDQFSLLHDYTKIGFLGITSTEEITSVRWTTTNGRKVNTGIDNIRTGSIKKASLIGLEKFEAIDKENAIDLIWITGSEVDNAGFRIWRATNGENGEYKNISTLKEFSNGKLVAIPLMSGLAKPIAAKGSERKKTTYSYTDRSVQEKNVTFYYLLEDVDIEGNRTFHCDHLVAVLTSQNSVSDLKIAQASCKDWCHERIDSAITCK
jgi:hypothetical protein